ncbi:stage III sporulation protein AF [Peribacillus kribbensis]|uniref:stage III sporulation protein AF n=1 Tax=Peribacillus kribbensis TaxID=356658 RepID=UPI00041FF1AC|nr:stage III sporulation protein AF [Peribacillus kribbensis]
MQFITSWVTNIILFILLATVIDMLLPNSSMQKYAKMVIGLLLIAIILSPILKLFSADFEQVMAKALNTTDQQRNTKNLIEAKKKEIQASQQAYILKQMAVQLKKDAKEELMNKYQLELAQVDIESASKDNPKFPNDIKNISLVLKPAQEGEAVEAVTPVKIDISKPLPRQNAEMNAVKKFLAAKWSVKEEILTVELEGGGVKHER